MLVYCDSVILIYHVEGLPPFQQRAVRRLAALWAAGDQVAVSDLTRLECRVHPLQQNDALRLALLDGFFALSGVHKLPLSTAVYDRATAIRARFAFKTTDAIHLAAAVEGGCRNFLTHDLRLARFPDIPVEVLP